MPLTQPGISIAWLAEDLPEDAEELSVIWRELANTEPWEAWLTTHMRPLKVFSVVTFDERHKARMMVRGDDLSYHIPAARLRDGERAGHLPAVMQEVFFEVYRKWAEKRGLPKPPTSTTVVDPVA